MTYIYYLIGSIVFTSWLTLALKMVDRLKISTLQAIVWNYLFCVITGFLVSGKYPMNTNITEGEIWKWAILIGSLFILLFNVIAITAQKLGVAAASVSNKLSLVIPFLFSVLFFEEKVSLWQIAGIAVALLSVILTCYPAGGFKSSSSDKKEYLIWFLPMFLFAGSGILDTLINYIQKEIIKKDDVNEFIMSSFAIAAIGGLLIFLFRYYRGQEKWMWKSMLAGFFIGIPNYASIWCLMEVLSIMPQHSSVLIPVNNIGIVLFSTLTATFLFREKLSLINWIGIFMAAGSILLIAFC